MLRRFKLAVAALAVPTVLLLGGCQTGNEPAQSSLTETPKGVQCDKCEVTWVKVPTYAGGRQGGTIVGYSMQKRDACPDCRTAVETMISTGQLAHSCKTCGGNMSVCKAH